MQLVTIHASKGLQYPVVYLPALADRFVAEPDARRSSTTPRASAASTSAAAAPDWRDHVPALADEEAGEWLRLLYVAITRAQSQVVALVGADQEHPGLAAAPDAVRPPPGARRGARRSSPPSDDEVAELLARLAGARRAGPSRRSPADRRRRPAAPATPGRSRSAQLHPHASTRPGGARRTPP